MPYKITFLSKITLLIMILGTFLNSCKSGPFRWDPADPNKVPVNAKARAKKNIEEGKAFKLSNTMKGGSGGNFEFASSNPMWRASLDILDFTPLANVDYSGGVIITDWFSEGNERSIKISVRFLTNEIRADGLEVSLFEKKCDMSNICQTQKVKSGLGNEIKLEILKKAAVLAQEDLVRYKEKHGEYKNSETENN